MQKNKKNSSSKDLNLLDFYIDINDISQKMKDGPFEFIFYEPDDDKECKKFINKEKKGSLGYVVVGNDIGVELGSPATKSYSHVVWTKQDISLKSGIWISKNDNIDDKKKTGQLPFLQIVILQLDNEVDPDKTPLEPPKNLANQVPGFMARTLPGKSWIRIHKRILRQGFSLNSLGQCIYQSYKESFPDLVRMSILLSVNDSVISGFEPLCNQLLEKQRQNQKIQLENKGVLNECDQLNCAECEERPVCDVLKDAAAAKRK